MTHDHDSVFALLLSASVCTLRGYLNSGFTPYREEDAVERCWSQSQQIKQWQAQRWSLFAIAAQLGVDRKTVRQYVEQQDFSP